MQRKMSNRTKQIRRRISEMGNVEGDNNMNTYNFLYENNKPKLPDWRWFISAVIIFWLLIMVITARAEEGTASYYTYDSCRREGTSGIFTATGEVYNENSLTCALPNRKMFGKKVRVTNLKTGKSVIVRCNDLGPSKRLVRKGRIIDLSRQAFFILSDGHLEKGLLKVRVEIL